MLIRRIIFSDHIKNGQVSKKAFKAMERDKNTGLSTTLCGENLCTPSHIEEYRNALIQDTGKLGICYVSVSEVEGIKLDVIPNPIEDEPYGSHHHLIQDSNAEDKCPNMDHSEILAAQATRNGGTIPFEPHEKKPVTC